MKDAIRIAGIIRESIVDGPGIRFTIFCQGCSHACKECQNPDTWDFNGGYDCSISKITAAVAEDPLLDGVTFSGGDPMFQPEAFFSLAYELRKMNPSLNLLAFTGFTFEELLELGKADHWISDLLGQLDLLVDGRYVAEERDLTLLFRGSRNQRVIDVKKSLAEGKAVLDERYI